MNPFIIVTPELRATILEALKDRLDLLISWQEDIFNDTDRATAQQLAPSAKYSDAEYVADTIEQVLQALAQVRRNA